MLMVGGDCLAQHELGGLDSAVAKLHSSQPHWDHGVHAEGERALVRASWPAHANCQFC